ncbi:hypothetical protein BZK32_11990 [Escherichia coli]|nr:hypothetical protein BZK32_11990 [Escherichia coli]
MVDTNFTFFYFYCAVCLFVICDIKQEKPHLLINIMLLSEIGFYVMLLNINSVVCCGIYQCIYSQS